MGLRSVPAENSFRAHLLTGMIEGRGPLIELRGFRTRLFTLKLILLYFSTRM